MRRIWRDVRKRTAPHGSVRLRGANPVSFFVDRDHLENASRQCRVDLGVDADRDEPSRRRQRRGAVPAAVRDAAHKTGGICQYRATILAKLIGETQPERALFGVA